MTARIGLDGLFDDLFDIEAAGFAPKPQPESFKALIARHSLTPTETLFFEDSARNLETAHALGFQTVFIGDWREGGGFPEHIHHAHACIKSFLRDHVVSRLTESPARAEA
jgi:putative hydrolase of the HAD superfamily